MQEDVIVDEALAQHIEVSSPEMINLSMTEAFPTPNQADALNHATLNNRELYDAHPISSITGLREELDEIERLKTERSDKYNVANYYEWADGAAYDTYGYFVSVVPDTSTIKICDGADIFGVSVDGAGFVGGDSDVVSRGAQYGLIATSGLVDVRCELDVEVGDYVTSNRLGYARKGDSKYGYKVLGIEYKNFIPYAIISLGVQSDVMNILGAELNAAKEQIDVNEKNIISATNVANQAFNKASEVAASNSAMSGKVESALGVVDRISSEVSSLESQVASSATMAAQAQAIAQSAATAAEGMRNEAYVHANETLVKLDKLREDFDKSLTGASDELLKEVNTLKESHEKLEQNAGDMKETLDKTAKDLSDLAKDLEPLAVWPEGSTGDDTKGVAGFVAQAKADGVALASIVEWKDGSGNESLAGFVQKTIQDAEVNTATAAQIAKVNENVASVQTTATNNSARIDAISGVGGSIAGLQTEVNNNKASLSTLASHVAGEYTTWDTWDATKAEQDIIYYVRDTKEYWYYDEGWISTSKPYEAGLVGSIAGIQSIADANKAQLDAMVGYDKNGTSALVGMLAYVDDSCGKISNLATYSKDNGDGTYTTGAAGLIGQVDESVSKISAITNKTFTKNDGSTVTGLSGLEAYVNDTESVATLASKRVSGVYTVIPEVIDEGKRDQDKIYASHDETTKKATYYYYQSKWESIVGYEDGESGSNTDFKQLASKNLVSTDMIYYVSSTKLYWYYENNTWKKTDDPSVAGLPASIAGIQVVTDDNSASINSLTSWQGETNTSMARIEQKADANGAYIQSTVANIDKYSVGPYSQAYGFTLEQAISVLEEGIMYAPTENVVEEYTYSSNAVQIDEWNDAGKDVSKVYSVTNNDTVAYWYCSGYDNENRKCIWSRGTSMPTYSRTFQKYYLYQWGRLNGDGPYRWITVDKSYSPIDDINASSKAVMFKTDSPPSATDGNDWGYWYINGETDAVISGTNVKYEPYTLYKWTESVATILDDDGHTIVVTDESGKPVTFYYWAPVATLAGNSQNRAVSQIRQDANSISYEVTNPQGSLARMGAKLTETSAEVDNIAAWKNGEKESKAIIYQKADGDEASIVISTLRKDGDAIKETSIVLNANDDGSALCFNADNINFTATADYSVLAQNINLTGNVSFSSLNSKVNSAVVSNIIEYALSQYFDTFVPVDGASGKWSKQAPAWQEGSYMWQRTVIKKADGTSTTTTACIQGASGQNGVMCWIESSSGLFFEDGASGTTTLTARLYRDAQDIDESGEFYYVWYTKNDEGEDSSIGVGKTLDVNIKDITGKRVYFIADDEIEEDVPTIAAAGLFKDGVMVKSWDELIAEGLVVDNDGTITSSYDTNTGDTSPKSLDGDLILPYGVREIGNKAFYECTSLKGVTIPDSVTSVNKNAFYNCSSLTNVIIPDSVTSIGVEAFRNCSSLTSITIGNGVKNIGRAAFNYCNSLTSVHITDIEAWCEIDFSSSGSNPLDYAKNLYLNGELVMVLEIPDSVTSIGDNVFYGCGSLISVTIPDSVTSIGEAAFRHCTALTSVTIPNSVTSIGDFAFWYCKCLANITFTGTVDQWNAIEKSTSWNSDVPAIYVTCSNGQVSL